MVNRIICEIPCRQPSGCIIYVVYKEKFYVNIVLYIRIDLDMVSELRRSTTLKIFETAKNLWSSESRQLLCRNIHACVRILVSLVGRISLFLSFFLLFLWKNNFCHTYNKHSVRWPRYPSKAFFFIRFPLYTTKKEFAYLITYMKYHYLYVNNYMYLSLH